MNQMNSKSTLNFWEKRFFVWVNNSIYSRSYTIFKKSVQTYSYSNRKLVHH